MKPYFLSLFLLSTLMHAQQPYGQRSADNPLAHTCFYAPHREAYIESATEQTAPSTTECVFCRDLDNNDDSQTFILARFNHTAVFLNLFPKMKGHLLVIPYEHKSELIDLSSEARWELMEILSALPGILKKCLKSAATNIGINMGRAAGATKPEHLHVHVIPRYKNEITPFLQLIEGAMCVDWDLHKMYQLFKPALDELQKKLCS